MLHIKVLAVRPLPCSYFFPCPYPLPIKWLATLVNPEPNYMKRGVKYMSPITSPFSQKIRTLSKGELLALQSQRSLAPNQSGILFSVTFHCCEADAPLSNKVGCKQAAERKIQKHQLAFTFRKKNTYTHMDEHIIYTNLLSESHTGMHRTHIAALSHGYLNKPKSRGT